MLIGEVCYLKGDGILSKKGSFQLTKHPVGSIREIWALSWPLMFGLISNSLMVFVDRLYLSWHSTSALNASASGGMAYFVFLVLPMAIVTISEVLAGRLNGEGKLKEVGNAVWQMVWFSLMISPLLWLIALLAPTLLFYQSGTQALETIYFQVLLCFAPFICINISLNGFFISTGKVSIVTYATLLGNVINMVLAYILIFGAGPIPSLGITGAAIATALSQIIQTCFLMSIFLCRKNREKYATQQFRFQKEYFKEGLRIGAPSGLGHAVEIFAHFLFFRIVMMVSAKDLTIVILVQSIYILIAFVIEAQSKGISGIASNLIGAKKYDLMDRVCVSGLKLHSFFFLGAVIILFLFPDTILNLFISEKASNLLHDPAFTHNFYQAMMWMSFFFLFDGFAWIVSGFLVAAGDTKFILYLSTISHWVVYIIPVYIFVYVQKNGADVAWMIIAFMSAMNFLAYVWRYRSGKWLKKSSVES